MNINSHFKAIVKMNVNSHFKIQRKNGECVSPISEINHDISDVMFTISKLVTINKRCLNMSRPKTSVLQIKSAQLFHNISCGCITNTNKAFNKY